MSRRRHPPAPQVHGDVVAVIALGGALGAVARYGLGQAWPADASGFPWSTFSLNVAGCFAIGLLLVALTEGAGPPHRLARPFFGTGLLGGFTTFSAYAVEAERLLAAGATAAAITYVLATVIVAVLAAQLGVGVARAARRAPARRRAARAPDDAAIARTHERKRSS